jgi:hypothetical protein
MADKENRKNALKLEIFVEAIDISFVDWAYKSSTCDVMYRRQRRHLYYGGQI